MPPESANSSPEGGYWYGNSLPTVLDGLAPEGANPRMIMRRASEAVVQAASLLSHMRRYSRALVRGRLPRSSSGQCTETGAWDDAQSPLHLDTSTLVLRPQSSAAGANHKAPLAPKQGLGGSLAGSRSQHQSPIAGTYALRTPRGKITSIACESCRKRKSKCDGVRPKCNTCQSKNLQCVYDVAEDGKTTTQLRAHVRRLAKELDDMKSIVSLLAMAPDRTTATSWANELEKNGFAHHSADEIKKSLQDMRANQHQLRDTDALEIPSTESFPRPPHSLAASSYDGSSRDDSREPSQPALSFPPDAMDNATTYVYSETNPMAKFSFDCAFYRRTKRDMLVNGWDETQVFGRNEIDVDTILLGFIDPQDGQPVTTWSSRTVNKILPAAPLPLRLASTYLLTKMMRWLIWPSVQNMNAMPEWLMPLARQESTPYDILVDLLPWPQLRQYMHQHPGEYLAGAFVGLIGLNWPYADDACHYWDIETGCTRMSPLFETAIGDLANWTLDAKAFEIIPHLEGIATSKV
ncbi:hypothetical protein K491DRAFT_587814 [Lophiostoma macrostomum CBS 122681]|uniref:Zn(2)-C6 fungal-type domain-containing protein n=1 Tax=Lophiostoma macrostomum CBS 122681 TaxID=1314788 RepID=A0A6A6TQQ9_9PLEO|nr:hypothetical protein K491DRAFT_587814 [Lophiostoma macrostomum CBS 122681]